MTPIYGAHSHNPQSTSMALPPNCTLVEYAGVKLLVNVGLDSSSETIDPANDQQQLPIPQDIDAILLCDATLESLGGLPKYVSPKNCPNIPPIYATYPVIQLGPMTLYDYHANVSLDGRNPGFTLDDVDALFTTAPHRDAEDENNGTFKGRFHTLKYSQSIPLTTDKSVTLTPHRSGHVVGGAYWILQRVADETAIVIALTYNPAKELHLDASTLLEYGGAPDVFVTRPGGLGGKLRVLYSGAYRTKSSQYGSLLYIF